MADVSADARHTTTAGSLRPYAVPPFKSQEYGRPSSVQMPTTIHDLMYICPRALAMRAKIQQHRWSEVEG